MNPRLKAIYDRLPAPLQNLAASRHGRRLFRLRYGPDTDQRVAEALARESFTPLQWAEWRKPRLAALLKRAAERVPFYREQWAARRAAGDTAPVEELANWPVLPKAAVRRTPEAFLADDVDRRRLTAATTTGTSGAPTRLWRSRRAERAWYALFEARWRRWIGLTRFDRWAIIGGKMVRPLTRTRPPFWVFSSGARQLYLSNYHISRETAPAYHREMERRQVRYLYTYPSSGHALALAFRAHDLRLPLAAVITCGEPLTAPQRDLMRDVFGCEVYETWGMAEMCSAASQCEHGALHLWPEAGVLEVVDPVGRAPVPPGEPGNFVCTGLLNDAMPLIRFELGDGGALVSDAEPPCPCGRNLPRLARIDGRIEDVLVQRNGEVLAQRVNIILEQDLHISAGRIVQDEPGRVRIELVPDEGFTAADIDRAGAEAAKRLGPEFAVDVVAVDALPLEPGGKVRTVVNNVPQHRRRGPAAGG
jgi:phenylacetate-CoA ligase